MILVNLANQRATRTFGIVDSGADENLFPASLARSLGHDLSKGTERRSAGIGGGIVSYLHRENSIQIHPDWKPFPVDICFSDDPTVAIALLGRKGFFKHFKITFDQKLQIFTLVPYDLQIVI